MGCPRALMCSLWRVGIPHPCPCPETTFLDCPLAKGFFNHAYTVQARLKPSQA